MDCIYTKKGSKDDGRIKVINFRRKIEYTIKCTYPFILVIIETIQENHILIF